MKIRMLLVKNEMKKRIIEKTQKMREKYVNK